MEDLANCKLIRPPPIELNAGDKLIVHAENGLGSVNTAMHHHGM